MMIEQYEKGTAIKWRGGKRQRGTTCYGRVDYYDPDGEHVWVVAGDFSSFTRRYRIKLERVIGPDTSHIVGPTIKTMRITKGECGARFFMCKCGWTTPVSTPNAADIASEHLAKCDKVETK